MDQIIIYIIAAVLLVLSPQIEKWTVKKYRRLVRQMQKNRKYESEISRIIEIMQHRFGAMRVIIWSYFNGIKNVVGQPGEFLSITYEETNDNVQPIADEFKMIPTTLWKDAIADVENHKGVLQIDIDHARDDMRYYMHKYHIERTYQKKIDESDLGQGLITIDFPSRSHTLSLRDMEFLDENCRTINILMKKIK